VNPTMALTLPGDPYSVAHARSLLDLLLCRLSVSVESRADLAVIMSEACSNAVCHGQQPGKIEIHVSVGRNDCVIQVANPGRAMTAPPTTAQPTDPLAEHGRGLSIIAALADSARFLQHRPGWVILRVAKRIVRLPRRGRGRDAGAGSA